MTLRRWHFYIGMFIAPSVLFFALTGALQLFSLHEAHGSYDPPPLIEKLSAVHKDQVFALPHRRPPPAAQASAPQPKAAPDEAHGPSAPALLLKAFFLLVALGLAFTTVLGLTIGLTAPRTRRAGGILVTAGTLIPIALLLI